MSFLKMKSLTCSKEWLAFAVVTALFIASHPSLTQAQAPSAPAMTNPSLKDSDGDGYYDGPDIWITIVKDGVNFSMLRIGEDKDGDGKYEPLGDDGIAGTWDDETDPTNPDSFPDIPAILIAGIDTDGDWLIDEREYYYGTSIKDKDTDDDGLSDGEEIYGMGRCQKDGWSFETSPTLPDSDGDGISDGTELGIQEPIMDSQTDPSILGTDVNATYTFLDYAGHGIIVPCFRADVDPSLSTFTDPLSLDTNGDGIKDGWQDKNLDGAFSKNGEDGLPGTMDDEQDPVFGFRQYYPAEGSYNNNDHKIYFWSGDEANPVSQQNQHVYFYWGSSQLQGVIINVKSLDGSNRNNLVISGAGFENGILDRLENTHRQLITFEKKEGGGSFEIEFRETRILSSYSGEGKAK